LQEALQQNSGGDKEVMKKIIVAITGATGVVYGARLLEVLRTLGSETHLIVSETATKNIAFELKKGVENLIALASRSYDWQDLYAPVSSGSFKTDGMVIAPCSIKTLSGIANSYNDNLIVRAADVTLKECRKLILMVRETPLHKGHLKLMYRAADAGAIILPPLPAFYFHPMTIDDLIDHSVGKALDLLDIQHDLYKRWGTLIDPN
jgi:flavin prenyltransferase